MFDFGTDVIKKNNVVYIILTYSQLIERICWPDWYTT